jgi:O-antigen/teichoic acid export membrane protein
MYSSGAAALINIGLNLKLIPLLGIVGASISMTLSAATMLIFGVAYVARFQQHRS